MKQYISSERVDLFEPNVYIQFLINFSKSPDPKNLELAIKTAFSNNESTMSRIVLDQDGAAFYEKIPFNLQQGEMIRAFILLSGKEISLLIMAHHLVGDGKSILYFLEDVFQSLSGERDWRNN